MGQIIGGVVGAVVGFYLGGPTGAMMGASLGAGLGGIVDPLEPDIPSPGQPDIANLDMATAQEGAVIVDFLGTSKMAGNIFYYTNSRVEEVKEEQEAGGKGGSSSKEVTVGHEYFLTWAIGLAVGPVDELYTVLSNDKVVWSGNLLRSEASNGKATITLEGMGSMTFYFGGTDQTAESVIGADVGTTVNPSYRGLCWAFFNDVSLGDYNRAPTVRFVMRKTPTKAFSASHIINTYDYNPAHAIWYILEDMCELNTSWLSTSYFASFASDNAASGEQHGVSVLFKHAEAIQYINSILQHIQAIMPFGDDTGQFEPKLLRADQSVSALTLVTDDDCLEPPMITSQSYIDTFNDVKVQYSQIYEFDSGEPAATVDFNADDDFSYVGLAATDKWNTYKLLDQAGLHQEPRANGTALWFSAAKTGEGVDEQTWVVVKKDYWMPGRQRAFELHYTADYDTLTTTDTDGFSPFRWGISTSGASVASYDVDSIVIGRGGISWYNVNLSFIGGVGNSSNYVVNDPDYWPLKSKIRRLRTGNQYRSCQSWYDNIQGAWVDQGGTPGSEWCSTFQNADFWYPFMDFSTNSHFRNSNHIVAGGVQKFEVIKGCFSCFDWDNAYSTAFTEGNDGDLSAYWVPANLGTYNARFGTHAYRLATNAGSPQADMEHAEDLNGMFKVKIECTTTNDPNISSGNTKRGFQVTDQVTGHKWFMGTVCYGGTARYWEWRTYNATGATWTIHQKTLATSDGTKFEIERHGNAGTLRGWEGADDDYGESTIASNNLLTLELINHSTTGLSFGGDDSVFDLEQFDFDYMEGGPTCAAVVATGAIDIRQATVHAEDPGNKEVLNRIRHKDERRMLFTRDVNARWGAGQAIRTTSIPLRVIEMKMDRRGIYFPPGENFRYTSAKYGITKETVFRVLNVREGNLDREEYMVNAIEDANYLSSLVVVDEADRNGSRINPFLLDVPAPDILEAPYSMVEENMYLVPLVGRTNGNEIGYHLYMSTDGTSYSKQASVTSFVTAGCLAATLNNSLADLDNTNTMKVDFYLDNDAQKITSISRADLIAGKNLAVLVNGATQEIIGFENINPVASGLTGRYDMTNLYRGRYDTETYSWPTGSKFYYIGTAPPLVHMPALVKGNTRYFKFIFYNTLKVGDISEATAVQRQITGRAWTPYQPGGFRANDASENTPGGPVYTSGISLEWNPEIRGTGAGRQDPDVVVDAAPTWEGYFEVVGLISGATAFTDTAINAATAAYTEGEIKAWNGGTLPSQITFKLTNYRESEGVRYQSAYNTLTVNKGN
jgi:hypothetical protein